MPDDVTIDGGLFVVGIGRAGGFRVIAAPQRMIDDGTYRFLRDTPASGLRTESEPMAGATDAPTVVGERFKVVGPDFGLAQGDELLDDVGRRFHAIRGLVFDSGPCVVVGDVTQLLTEVPDLYRAFLRDESTAPLGTGWVKISVRPVEKLSTRSSPIEPRPPQLRRLSLVLTSLLLLGLLWYVYTRF